MYGISDKGLSANEHIPLKDAKKAIDGLMEAYPKMKAKIDYDQSFAEKHGYVENMMGFRRRLGGIKSNNKYASSKAIRQAFNADIQGSGSYCTNTALIAITNLFRVAKLKSKLVITVHDSVVVDTYPTEIDKVAKICQYCFSHLDIPDVKYCPVNSLKVPDKMKTGKDTFRFPLHGEVELGCNYNDDVDYDPNEAKTFKSIYMYAKFEYAKQILKDHLDNNLLSKEDYHDKIAKLNKVKPIFQNKTF